MPTPHNNAAPGAFAKTVLMPGDPLRSKFIAETFLENPVLVNNVRGVQGYTGTYKGVPVSVMASGMGMPSIGIYAHELYTQYGVENIIRVGSAGAMRADLELGSVVAGQGACTNSSFADQYELGVHYAPIADFDLLMAAVESARELGVKMPVGNLYSSDTFYGLMKWRTMYLLIILEYSSVCFNMWGRGPTMDISPSNTLMNCGSSSILVRRMKSPNLVFLGSLRVACKVSDSLFTFMERNL